MGTDIEPLDELIDLAEGTDQVEASWALGEIQRRRGGQTDLTEERLQQNLAKDVALRLLRGERPLVRRLIRQHYDPSWFVLEVLKGLGAIRGGDADTLLLDFADLRRLLSA